MAELGVSSKWAPLTPEEVTSIFDGSGFLWCVAGGHAVEQFVGSSFRAHGDIDVSVLRPDQLEVQSWLRGWRLFAADPPGTLRPWRHGEVLPDHVHDIWAHKPESRAWELQIMLENSDGERWLYRRDRRIYGELAEWATVYEVIPCLRIDLQLLYKSKDLNEKNTLDFRHALPRMSSQRKDTLAGWLSVVYPEGHPWIGELGATKRSE